MTYQKRFSSFQNRPNVNSILPASKQTKKKPHTIVDPTFKVFGNRLPEYYSGHPSRIVRYNQYEMMDNDAEVNACLDIIAEFSTQISPQTKTPFVVNYANDPTPHEVEIITKQLQQWCKLNDFNTRIFKIFRNCLKYGDQIFIRDPENFKLYWIDMTKVIKVNVNEATGKTPEQYIVQDLNPNFENLTAASKTNLDFRTNPSTAGYNAPFAYTVPNSGSTTTGSRFSQSMQEFPIDAKHIVHLSLTEGLDRNWPFGQSILESIFKVYKQKELLEDAILIYRVQRAPERRVFKIDVGNMPSHMAMAFVNKVKDEIHQRRIPTINNQNNANGSLVDSTYNAMHQLEDYFFPQSCISLDTKIPLIDGRTLTLSELIVEYEQGKQNYVFSINQQTFQMEPGKILWAGVTRKQAKVLEVELDNGEKVRVTPDHRFIMWDGSEKHAEFLEIGVSIMPLNSELIIKVNKVVELFEVEDTGDLTIEVNHNFAVSAGVYVHNSDGRGSSVEVLPGGCFAMDTLVPLLDGRELTIAQISDELQTGEELWTYSCEPKTGKIVPGYISWAGMTQKSAKVMRFTLDNGKTFICTPEHEFPVYGEEFKRADEFNIGDTVIKFVSRNLKGIPEVYDNETHEWLDTNQVIKQFIFGSEIPVNACNAISETLIQSIEYLDEEIPVGTLTIDQNEVYHGYHTFALSAGIMTKNSNLGDLQDLKYFDNKMARGLRVPSSYLPTGPEDNPNTFGDGKVGTALIQELRFNQYCQRLQRYVCEKLDLEFKMFLRWRGFNIDTSLFDLEFCPPQNFAAYRMVELDTARSAVFTSMEALPYMSKRFAMERFLGLTEEEIKRNEKLWTEEHSKPEDSQIKGSDLRNVGISTGDIESDQEAGESAEAGEEAMGELEETPPEE